MHLKANREKEEGTSEDEAIVYGGRIAGREITTLANKLP